jgi:hypothetical protein
MSVTWVTSFYWVIAKNHNCRKIPISLFNREEKFFLWPTCDKAWLQQLIVTTSGSAPSETVAAPFF